MRDDESMKSVFELLKVWGMETPRLLISVTGGAKSFNLDPKLKSQFATGLLKVSELLLFILTIFYRRTYQYI